LRIILKCIIYKKDLDMMKPIAVSQLSDNFFETISKEWMLVTAGNKNAHKICGSKSGREVDKIKETGLKPMITDKGNVLFEQGRLSLECRKLYTDVLRKENFLDPSVYEQWYTTHGGLHHVYVAEITSAWIKDKS